MENEELKTRLNQLLLAVNDNVNLKLLEFDVSSIIRTSINYITDLEKNNDYLNKEINRLKNKKYKEVVI